MEETEKLGVVSRGDSSDTSSHVLLKAPQDYPTAIMKRSVASAMASTASATELKLTWSDCGDASTKAKITSFSPDHLTLGQTTTMVGTGTVSEDVSAATYDLEMDGVIHLLSCKGDASQSKTCSLPLGAGSLSFDAMSFPLKAGQVQVKVDIALSANLPASLASTTTKATATGSKGNKLFCIEIKSSKEARSRREVLSGEERTRIIFV
jgi:hypothetical protein